MSDKQHPITPPPELLTRWGNDWLNEREHADVLLVNAYVAGAQAGADMELEACCKWLDSAKEWNTRSELYAARRPKPPSLKEQALAELAEWENVMDIASDSPIRRALEQLND